MVGDVAWKLSYQWYAATGLRGWVFMVYSLHTYARSKNLILDETSRSPQTKKIWNTKIRI